jgi:hypothetical protein
MQSGFGGSTLSVTALGQQAEFSKDQLDVGHELAGLDRERETIANQVATGKLSELQGEEAIAAVEAQRIPKLRDLAAHATALAQQLGNPDLLDQAKALTAQIDALEASTDLAGKRAAEFRAEIEGALSGALSNFLANGFDRLGQSNPDTNEIDEATSQAGRHRPPA